MKHIVLLIGVLLLLGAGAGTVYWLQSTRIIEVPKFSQYASTPEVLQDRASREFVLMTFDASTDIATSTGYRVEKLEEEIEYLITRAADREASGEEKVVELLDDALKISFGQSVLREVATYAEKPYTRNLIDELNADLENIIATEQLRFDVARPMQIDLRVNSPLDTPNSPSYPSELAAKLKLIERLFAELNYVDETFAGASKKAIDSLYVYGVHTRTDVEYGETIANAYFDKVLNATPNVKEFLQLLSEREWGREAPLPVPDGPLPDIKIITQSAEAVPQGILFKAKVSDVGVASTPASYPVELQVDIYGDGTIDIVESFEAVQLYSDSTAEISYFTTINRAGDHLFRFILDPRWDMNETNKLNNYGSWTSLTK